MSIVRAVALSYLTCIDESMSRWYGLKCDWVDIELSYYISIDRKPDSDCEISNSAYGPSVIILHLEIVKGADETCEKEFETQMLHVTAVTSRLVDPWINSNMIVCNDSYFRFCCYDWCVATVRLRFLEVVNTEIKRYRMDFISRQKFKGHGQSMTMTYPESYAGMDMMAVMWVDRNRRYFISTTVTSLLSSDTCPDLWQRTEFGTKHISRQAIITDV